MKNVSTGLKTLLAVGGWNAGSVGFSTMVDSPDSRRQFVISSVEFLRKYGFNGLDLDWEYPTQRGGKRRDKRNFALLVKVSLYFYIYNLFCLYQFLYLARIYQNTKMDKVRIKYCLNASWHFSKNGNHETRTKLVRGLWRIKTIFQRIISEEQILRHYYHKQTYFVKAQYLKQSKNKLWKLASYGIYGTSTKEVRPGVPEG